jgi:calcineurin-like phosphoesterase family protein
MVFFTSDLHLGHQNIIRHCSRPFSDVDEMNHTLIDNWNSRVARNDEVWIVGDFSFRSEQDIPSYLEKLKGRKHLIIGNHDGSWMKKADWSSSFESIDMLKYFSLDGHEIVLCHYPMMCWPHSNRGSYLVYGHIHGNTDMVFWPLIRDNPFMLNAGVDVNGFYPVTFAELVKNNEAFKESHPAET